MFFETTTGEAYPMRRVQRFVHDYRKGILRVWLDDGEAVEVKDSSWDLALAGTVQAAFPASAGTYLLHRDSEDKTPEDMWRTPVIGWAVTSAGFLEPITADGIERGDHVLLLPDGQVAKPQIGSFRSIEQYWNDGKA